MLPLFMHKIIMKNFLQQAKSFKKSKFCCEIQSDSNIKFGFLQILSLQQKFA